MSLVALPTDLGGARVGGKARGLSELMRWGCAVPPAFVLPPGASCDRPALDAALHALGGLVAVRSSGVAEDGVTRSFAGMHDTVLGVATLDALEAAIATCRASATSARAAAYRGDAPADTLAVVIQRQVAAVVAGVAFSADPVSGRRGCCVIEAVPGLGEGLVSGRVTPDRATFDAVSRAVEALTPAPGRVACLDAPLATRVAELTLEVARHAGGDVDVEWAWDGATLWALQWRPVTALPTPNPRVVWTNTNAAELLPEVARPLTFDVLNLCVAQLLNPLMRPLGMEFEKLGIVGLVGGRVYFNMNAALGWTRAFPLMRLWKPAGFARLLGGDQRALAAALATVRVDDLPTHRVSLLRVLAGSWAMTRALVRFRSGDGSALIAATRAQTTRLTQVRLAELGDEALVRHFTDLPRDVFGESDENSSAPPSGVGMLAQFILGLLCRWWLGDSNGALSRRLLSGVGSLASAAPGTALRLLGAKVARLGLGAVAARPWDEARPLLQQTAEGREVLADLDVFFAEHGHHARGEVDVALPRWSETPGFVWAQLGAFASSSGTLTEHTTTAQRTTLIEETLARVGPLRRALLRSVLQRAALGAATRENAKDEGVRRLGLMRLAALEVGRRLVERGTVSSRDDVFFLQVAELSPALAGGAQWAGLVDERRQRHARCEAVTPPDVVVGSWQPARPSREDTRPATRGEEFTGIAASMGVVEGPARVIGYVDEGARVLPGEVLVAPFTDPGWTPLFISAAAVVMDFGGMLSHGAIVAREYGLPAVVNVGPATRRLRTGQRVRVDGNSGVVTVLED
ncbi:MAG: PEP/pyruvate-binding domain-containing protein [Archangium sp.]|nr:PEP/pyruvate-binding domain-containing protein [Archangium sp.]